MVGKQGKLLHVPLNLSIGFRSQILNLSLCGDVTGDSDDPRDLAALDDRDPYLPKSHRPVIDPERPFRRQRPPGTHDPLILLPRGGWKERQDGEDILPHDIRCKPELFTPGDESVVCKEEGEFGIDDGDGIGDGIKNDLVEVLRLSEDVLGLLPVECARDDVDGGTKEDDIPVCESGVAGIPV
ncbi:hypothetical protein DSECCO2_607980 [anaerobic digester metagenome]